MVAAALLALSVFACALGAPTPDSVLHLHDARSAAPAGYHPMGVPDPDTILNLRIALKTDSTALLQNLYDVSTPGSTKYRQFLTKEQVDELTAPSEEAVSTIKAWLEKNGVTAAAGATNQWLNIELPVSTANAMLDADFTIYNNPDTGVTTIRTLAYSVPKSVQPHLDFIYPATAFPVKASKHIASVQFARNSTHTARAVDASCASEITPRCLQELYNIPTTPAKHAGNTMAVSSFVDSFASASDLRTFLVDFRPDIASTTTFNVVSLDGGKNDQTQPSAEGSLDIQYTVGIATNVPTTLFTVGSDPSGGDLQGFLDLVNSFISQTEPPTVFSTSFGFAEEQVPQDLAVNLCNAYAQLGVRGTSVLFSSGDSGVDDGQDSLCTTTFRPTFPATCPFVTVVGATQGVNPEIAADFSSGGFSNLFSQPTYQANTVANYLNLLGGTNAGLFTAQGRGYPDVSAQGVAYVVNIGNTLDLVSGTSASTPLFASMVALLNDRLIAQGKSTIGFLNPFLYSTGLSALNDVTVGSNPGCGTQGFPANAGWDPITGLGTPDFNKLSLALGL